MEIVYRKRGIVEYCPKKEYLERILEQFRSLRRIEEIQGDRMFESTVDLLRSKLTLVEGDARRITFRFSEASRKHHRGDTYMLSRNGNLLKVLKKPLANADGDFFLEPEPHVVIAPIESLTAGELLEGINLIIIQEILEL